MTECLRQTVQNSWASVRRDLSPNVSVCTRGVTKVSVQDADRIVLLECKTEGDRQAMRACSRDN